MEQQALASADPAIAWQRSWGVLIEDTRIQFQRESSFFHRKEFDIFQIYLNDSATRFTKKSTSTALAYFQSSLRPLKSFAFALAVMTGAKDAPAVVCGATQALLETAYRYAETMDITFNSLADLNASLQAFHRAIIPDTAQEELQAILQETFKGYTEFCLRYIRILRPKSFREKIWNLLFYFIDASPEISLSIIQTRIKGQGSEFRSMVTYYQDLRDSSQTMGTCSSPYVEFDSFKSLNIPVPGAAASTSSSVSLPSLQFPTVFGRPPENYAFMGRQTLLNKIHEALQSKRNDQRGPACCVIHGIGGIGKTQTALKYTHAYISSYEAIFWVKADVPFDMKQAFSEIAVKLRLTPNFTPSNSSAGSDISQKPLSGIGEALQWFVTTTTCWLLVFDNVNERDDILEFIPDTDLSSGSILITTQRLELERLTKTFERIQVDSFTTEEGCELLLEKIAASREPEDGSNHEIAEEISNIVGGLPLTIATIGGYITASGLSLIEFLVTLKTSNEVWAKTENNSVIDYEKTLATVFDIALKKLPPDGRKLLNVLAYMNADFIPEEMLIGDHGDKELDFLINKHKFSSMLIDLKARQLVRRDPPKPGEIAFLSLHRSLQLSLLNTLSDDHVDRMKTFHQAFLMIRKQLPAASKIQVSDPKGWEKYKRYVPQIISLQEHSRWPEPPLILDYYFAEVLADIGNFLRNAGLLSDARAMLKAAEDALLGLGKNHDRLMSDIDVLVGIVNDQTGITRRADSLERFNRALAIRKTQHEELLVTRSVTREDEIRLWNAHADLGCTYLGDERTEEAAKIFEECLVQYKIWGSDDEYPYEHGKYPYYMSFVRSMQGRHAEALDLCIEACRLQERHAGGANALLVHNYRFALANRYYQDGQFDVALELSERVLAARRQYFGDFNKFTRESYSSTGAMLHMLGQADKAKDYLKTALNNPSNWSEEGKALAHKRLSRVLFDLEEVETAVIHREKAEAIRDRCWIEHSEYMSDDPSNEMAVYNRMTSQWSGRLGNI